MSDKNSQVGSKITVIRGGQKWDEAFRKTFVCPDEAENRPCRIRLYYFDTAGKAEAIRLALNHAGLDFEDYRFAGWPELFEFRQFSTSMFGQVPALQLTFEDGTRTLLTDSASILRWIAKAAPERNMYPTCPIKANKVDAILTQSADTFSTFLALEYTRFGTDGLDDATKQECFRANAQDYVPYNLALLERQLKRSGNGWLAGTKEPSICDFKWGSALEAVKAGWMKDLGRCMDVEKCPLLNAYLGRYHKIPSVAKYYENPDNKFIIWFEGTSDKFHVEPEKEKQPMLNNLMPDGASV